MKRILIICCVAIATLGISALLKFVIGLSWLISSLPVLIVGGGAIIIYTLRFALKKLNKSSQKGEMFTTGDSSQIQRDIQTALNRYVQTTTKKGVGKRSALYQRPFFLILGPKGSGKSSLMDGSGLAIPRQYPGKDDGLVLPESSTARWLFGNEAVWIDLPGSFCETTNNDKWQSFTAGLAQARAERPIDGLLLTVNADDVLQSDPASVKQTAQQLRGRIDEAIATWGIEFPVYLIFNQSDKIPGFSEFFAGQSARAQQQVFGATLTKAQQKQTPRLNFLQEFALLSESLAKLRVEKLYHEKDEAKKRLICRFVIHFEGIQQKLASFVTEIFKPSTYVGKPVFRGFYFTSCVESTQIVEKEQKQSSSQISNTIVNHPLNPHRAPTSVHKKDDTSQVRKNYKSLFVLPLFGQIMLKDMALVTVTQSRTRQSLLRYLVVVAIALTIFGGTSAFFARSYSNVKDQTSKVTSALSVGGQQLSTLAGELQTLAELGQHLPPYNKRTLTIEEKLGFFPKDKVTENVFLVYKRLIEHVLLVRVVKYYESRISAASRTFGDLSGNQYELLYNSLKTYLSISEAVSEDPTRIDTSFLRVQLSESFKRVALRELRSERLPQSVELNLSRVLGQYLYLLKLNKFNPIQENQLLVQRARQRLKKLPDAQKIYDALSNELRQRVATVDLSGVVGNGTATLLQSTHQISLLYTQQGFDEYVDDELKKASANPFTIDWVIGAGAAERNGELIDSKKFKGQLLKCYLADYAQQWTRYMETVSVVSFQTLPRSGRLLAQLISPEGELQKFFKTIAEMTHLKQTGLAASATEKILDKTPSMLSERIADRREDPFEILNSQFEPLRKFIAANTALGGYSGYVDAHKSLAEALVQLEANGSENLADVFNASKTDPLQKALKAPEILTAQFEGLVRQSTLSVLVQPANQIASLATQQLADQIASAWQNDIYQVVVARFKGKFPFNESKIDAQFADFGDFFRPETGIFWEFYHRLLAPYFTQGTRSWRLKTVPGIALNFNEELLDQLEKTHQITTTFFNKNGQWREFQINAQLGGTSSKTMNLSIDGQKSVINAGRKAHFTWPHPEGNSGASLSIEVSDGFTQDMHFGGEWGLLRLLHDGNYQKVNNSQFQVKYKINVQNMYTLFQNVLFSAGSADHPFDLSVMRGFNLPREIVSVDQKVLSEIQSTAKTEF